jgi:formylglycine-generating enzyme required for sulfatase activity
LPHQLRDKIGQIALTNFITYSFSLANRQIDTMTTIINNLLLGALLLLPITTYGNTAPTISDIAARSISQGSSTGALAFTINDAQTAASALQLSANSSNTNLVPKSNIVFGGSGKNRTVTVTPIRSRTGTATITVTVSDGKLSRSDNFLLTVRANVAVPTGFALIPAGAFTMGNSVLADADISDAPTRTVILDAFYMAKYELTKAEWNEVRTWGLSNGYTDLVAGAGKANNHPVQGITWYQFVKWCNARSQKEGLTPVYYTNNAQTTVYKTGNVNVTNAQVKWTANGYRLPTEAEWEKAARGGLKSKRFPWGDTISHNQSNYYAYDLYDYDLSGNVNNFHPKFAVGSAPYTSPVGSFKANDYGLYDITGNVWEWCWDWYGAYTPGSQTNPLGANSGSKRIIRGGSWDRGPGACRIAKRFNSNPSSTIDSNTIGTAGIGIRLARSISASPNGFAMIPATSFIMGNSVAEDADITDAPTRKVTLDAFYIGKCEVTKAEWDEVRAWGLKNGYTDLVAGAGKASNHPVHSISWYQMVKWCNARSEKERLTPAYYTNNAQSTIYKTGNVGITNSQVKWNASGYRLPTEAEWEKAARGGLNGKRFPWGDTISHSQANYYAGTFTYSGDTTRYYDNFDLSYQQEGFHPTYNYGSQPYTSPVASFVANGFGLHDVAGNVLEYCWDRYGSYASGNQTNPRGPMLGDSRVARGGSWYYFAYENRTALRMYSNPSSANDMLIGFRVLRNSAP